MSASSSSSTSSSESEHASPPLPLKRKRVQDDPNSSGNNSSDSEAEQSPDIPALSHAEKRRQKKKGKLNLKEKESSPASKRQKFDPQENQAMKRQNSVWVGNVSFKTTPESLKAFFDGVGDITRIHMPMKAATVGGKGENRGFAYVDFATSEAKIIAISMSEKPLIGRRLLIKDGDDFAGRPVPQGKEDQSSVPSNSLTVHSKIAQKILRAQKEPPAPTLFLGNLGFEATEKSIREILEAHRAKSREDDKEGEQVDAVEGQAKAEKKDVWIRKIRMGTFEDTGHCKGWAFVDFTSIEHATAALINPKNHHLDGRKLVVEYASPEAVRRGGGPRPKRDEAGDRANSKKWEGSNRKKGESTRLPHRSQATETSDAAGASEGTLQRQQAPSRDRPPHESRPSYSGSGAGGGGRKDRVSRNRTKPGAALALAKRESAAIIPSEGKKIKF